MSKKVLVAVAWPYVNGDLHLGHLAGYLLPADIFARYQRLKGNDVMMVSGSDCHGSPITVEADKQKLHPEEIVAKYHQKDIELFALYDLSYNLYTKTTTSNHKRVTQEMFLQLLKNGFISKASMQQYYSEEDKQFLPDRYVEGTCPYCKAQNQRSDQCEVCGRWLGDGELIDPVSKLSGAKVALKDTEHYFLDFPKLGEQLKTYLESKKDTWREWVWAEANGWLKEGLNPRAITRDMDWAIELPVEEIKKLSPDLQLKDFTGKRIYVWFEAVIGYLSAPQEWVLRQAQKNSTPKSQDNHSRRESDKAIDNNNEADVVFNAFPGQSSDWREWWLNQNAEQYYFMGQDNLVFHTLMWPAQLIGSKQGYTLPHNVCVNKFMNYEGKKFSKSRGWTIDSKQMANKYGTDLVRFYIASNLPENKEANFTWEGFVDSINNELIANLGNFINRSLKFFESKFEGNLEDQGYKVSPEVGAAIDLSFANVGKHLDKCEFVQALEQVLALSRFGNQYFDQEKLWELVKNDIQKAKVVMLDMLNIIANLQILMTPFLPVASKKLADTWSVKFKTEKVDVNNWQKVSENKFKLENTVEILFSKLDKELVLKEKEN